MNEARNRPLWVVLYFKGGAAQSVTEVVTSDWAKAMDAHKALTRKRTLSTYLGAVYPDGHVDLKSMSDPNGIAMLPDRTYIEVARTPIADMVRAARANAPTDQPEWGPMADPDEEIRIETEGAASYLEPRTDSER